jgi:hypothetical protein
MAKKKLSSKSNYVPNRMINEIEVERNGKTTYIDGANVLDGMYVKKGVKFAKGGSIQKIVSNFTPVAVKHSGNEKEGYSVLIKDKKSDFTAWVDVWVDTEYQDVNTDWNMYIFDLKDTNDVRQKTLQENTDIFEDATSTAIQYLEDKGVIMQDDKAKWHYAKGKKALGGFLVGVGVGVAGKYAYDKYGKKGTTKRVAKGKKKKFGNGGGTAVSSENGGYTVGTNADFNSNQYQPDVDLQLMKRGGGLKSKAKYVPNYMVQSVEVERKGKTTDIDGADILDGFYVKKGVKFANGGSVWGGTAESSQDGMLIGGTNSELTSNQYGEGGSIDTWEYSIGGL